ncbi:MAG: hypothetical protein NC118_02855 [Eubacterium sp.]|nr:hypothetical protein [Eubacterium sp.]
MSYLLTIYRKIVPEKVRKAYNESFQRFRLFCVNKREMQKKKYGTLNKDKTFYVVRTDSTQRWGIGTTCTMVLNNIKYAVNKGWIPVIDYKNYYLVALQDDIDRGKENAWEYYFEQPDANYSLEEVYKSQNVILGPLRGQPVGSLSWGIVNNLYDEEYDIYFKLTSQYIRLKPEILERAEALRKEIFMPAKNKKILGVGIRAGLYWGEVTQNITYKNHPEGLSIQQYIEQTYRYMNEFHCEYIFVSCDDRYYLDKMKQEFGEKCLYVKNRTLAHFFDTDGTPLVSMEERRIENSKESESKRTKDYIIEIYLLSKCDSLIKAKGGGAQLACLLNNKEYDNYREMRKNI